MDCPRCSVELTALSSEDSTIQWCSECGGSWVEVTDLNKILLHANLPALSSIPGYVNTEELSGLCPACQVELSVIEGGEKKALAYDTCESCGGIWVDGEADDPPAEQSYAGSVKEIVSFFRDFAKPAKKK
ncbi:MAG TPA: zf-TFIIB domain-containing protein [Anaeromyxobacteraceae bacterium]|nr:zf-TFIIB domain-containing protein [Anaeromyxobacteraceae bacterium]